MPTSGIGMRRVSQIADWRGDRAELALGRAGMARSATAHRLGPRAGISSASAFTLLELLATLAVMMLMLGLVLPGLGATRTAVMRSQARDLATHLELARQRAVVTGKTHRLWLDAEESRYRVEWLVSEREALGEPPEDLPPLDLGGDTPIPLSPRTAGQREFRPVPNRFGNDSRLSEGLFFAGVQTPEGWLERGQIAVVFDRDGTADAAEIVISDADDRRIILEVRPLLDAVRVRDE